MKTKSNNAVMQNKDILFVALAVALLLLVPLLAMQITDTVDWSATDFVLAGALLFGTGLAYVLVSRQAVNTAYRAASALALATALLLVWTNLAVGIIGSEDNPANLMYLGVLAVFVLGALIAQLRPRGMMLALFATALAQVLVTVIALITQPDLAVPGILAPNAMFVVLWVGSALLFRWAAATQAQRPA